MAENINRFVGSAVSISSNGDEEMTSLNTATLKPVDVTRNSANVRRNDENVRSHSRRLLDKFRKIRHTSKSAHESERKLNAATTDVLEDRENKIFRLAKNIGDPTVRRQSAVVPSLQLRSLTSNHLQIKGILKSTSKSTSNMNLNQDSTRNLGERQFSQPANGSTTLTNGEGTSDEQLSSNCLSSGQISGKLVKHVKFSDDTLDK